MRYEGSRIDHRGPVRWLAPRASLVGLCGRLAGRLVVVDPLRAALEHVTLGVDQQPLASFPVGLPFNAITRSSADVGPGDAVAEAKCLVVPRLDNVIPRLVDVAPRVLRPH